MQRRLSQFSPQPLTAIIISLLATISLIGSWLGGSSTALGTASASIGLALFLAAAIIAAGLNPIHIRPNLKVFLTTVPIYAAALLLLPAVAALTAGGSTLLVQLLTKSQRGNTWSDIATAAGRWLLTASICAWLAQQAAIQQWPLFLTLLSVAVVMFTCDIVTCAFEIAPMSGESPARLIVILLREASLPESAQYLLGILAVLAALQAPWSLVLWILPLWIVYRSFKHAKEMHDGTSTLLESMADAVDLRDSYTGGHSRRVTELTLQILHELNITGPEVNLIRSAARVHDIGKIGIPDHILNKPGQLTPEEKQLMDSHPERGAELLKRYKDFARGVDIVRHHHERWDGRGYPTRLKGLDIPFGARVIAVADSFDAMISDRPYRAGMTASRAAQILRDGRGGQWDPAIVDAFLSYLEQTDPQLAGNSGAVNQIAVSAP